MPLCANKALSQRHITDTGLWLEPVVPAAWLEPDILRCVLLWSMQLWDYSSDVTGCRGSKDNKKLRCQETVCLGPEFIAGVMDYIIPKGFESITHQKLHLEKSGAVTHIYKRACHSFMFSLSPPLYYCLLYNLALPTTQTINHSTRWKSYWASAMSSC